jgi:hypothetical protein
MGRRKDEGLLGEQSEKKLALEAEQYELNKRSKNQKQKNDKSA